MQPDCQSNLGKYHNTLFMKWSCHITLAVSETYRYIVISQVHCVLYIFHTCLSHAYHMPICVSDNSHLSTPHLRTLHSTRPYMVNCTLLRLLTISVVKVLVAIVEIPVISVLIRIQQEIYLFGWLSFTKRLYYGLHTTTSMVCPCQM